MTPRKETIGDCELWLGDCRDVLPTIAGASIEMIFTDPPYGHNNNNGDLIHRREAALGKLPNGTVVQGRPISNDGAAESTELIETLYRHAARILRPDSCCCCCCPGGGPDPQFARWSIMMDKTLSFDQMIVWDKGPMGMGWRYRRSYETVLVGHRKNGKLRWFDETNQIENIIRPGDYGIKKIIPKDKDHPTPKPVTLAAHFIKLHSKKGDIVIDPFMGGGSTAEACVSLGRRFIGIEIEEIWFEYSIRRIEDAYRQGDLFREQPRTKPKQEALL